MVESETLPVLEKRKMTTQIQQSIWFETSDGEVHEVELETAKQFSFLCKKRFQSNLGPSKTSAIDLPNFVSSWSLELIIQFCRFYKQSGHSDKEYKMFNKNFFKLELRRLCELAAAAWSLEMTLLIELVGCELGKVISRMTDEEYKEAFKITDASRRYRLVNELYPGTDEGTSVGQSSSTVDGHRDHSSIDLDPFIDHSGQEAKRTERILLKKTKKKKKKKTKEQAKNLKLADSPEIRIQSALQSTYSTDDTRQSVDDFGDNQDAESFGETTEGATAGGLGDADDVDSDLERKEENDRDVVEFERRLFLSWPDRVQEIFALASESQASIRNRVPLVSSDSESPNSAHAVQNTHPQVVVQGGAGVQEQSTKSPCTFGRFLSISILLLLLYFLVFS